MKGVLFDVDGTLVNTTYLHTVCWWQALRQLDHDVPMAKIHRAIGMGSDRILDELLGTDRGSDPDKASHDDQLRTAKKTLYSTYWDRLRPLPGAVELLHACAKAGLAVVLASSASEQEMEKLRATLACDDVITAATSSADAERSKPDPGILQAALAQSGVQPKQAVFVGDTVWDAEAAGALQLPCIGLTSGGWSSAELADAGCVEVHDSPAALLEQLESSEIGSLARRSG